MAKNRPLLPTDWLVRLQPRSEFNLVSQSRTVLVTDLDGWIFPDSKQGLWIYQTRNLSRYQWTIEGKLPKLAGASNIHQHSWMAYYIAAPANCQETETHECSPSQQTIELRLTRVVGEGMQERVEVTNHTQISTSFELALEVAADFADPEEADGPRKQEGQLTRSWKRRGSAWELMFHYRAKHAFNHQGYKGRSAIDRAICLRLIADSNARHVRERIVFRIRLAPHAKWNATLAWTAKVDGNLLPLESTTVLAREDKRDDFLRQCTEFRVPSQLNMSAVVHGCLEQAKRDLRALRLIDQDRPHGWTFAAGIPSYVTLFGRDTLAASWESLLLSAQMVRGTLPALDKLRGDTTNNWRDEQPGKMVHEAHTSPLAALNFTPHGRYYGGITGSIYYPVVLSGLWHWTGDKDLVRRHVKSALAGLRWADRYGDIDGDGFYEYLTRSNQGEKNQGWKDSSDAIVYADGRQVKDPLGTCEMQGFAYASKLHLSELLWWLDEKDEAKRLFDQAVELKKRFNDVFWMEDEKFYAMGIDSKDHQITSIGSDPGHCLASGIVDEKRAKYVADRLMKLDMFSGWGVRTLSADHPAYNPFAYHRGTVWPVENAVFALAFARYGLHDHVNKLALAQFEAAALFEFLRPPELFSGHARDAGHPFPALYPRANWPQAWSASAVFTLLQAILGIYPYAPLKVLFVDPWLPDWLPEITLHNLQIGKAHATIRFRRSSTGRTNYDLLDQRGQLHVVRQPSPWSLTADFGERVRDGIMSLLPGKLIA